MPLGTPLLFLIAFGLFGYGLFRLYGAWADIKGKGSDAKGLFGRAGPVLSGIAHLLLAVLAVMIALDLGEGGGGGGEREVARSARGLPGGTILLVACRAGRHRGGHRQFLQGVDGRLHGRLDREGAAAGRGARAAPAMPRAVSCSG